MEDCKEKCGDVIIPYPFGIGLNCFIHDGFAITCNHTFSPPKPFLGNTNLEVLKIALNNEIHINNPVNSLGCSNTVTSPPANLSEIPLSPFSFSAFGNRFVSTSCNNFAKLTVSGNVVSGCESICNNNITKGCDGINCCKTALPYSLKYINASIEKINENDKSCKKMFVADWVANIVDHNFRALETITHVPTILEWRIDNENATLFKNITVNYDDDFGHPYDVTITSCTNSSLGGYRCFCGRGYGGNPYLPNGCEEIDECADSRLNVCGEHYCMKLRGRYYCSCKDGYYQTGLSTCAKEIDLSLKFSLLGAHSYLAKKGCIEKCGNVTIPYPFGIGMNCPIHDGFAITCNHTFNPPKPFLGNTNLEVLKIAFNGTMLINYPVNSYGCSNIVTSPPANLSEIPLSPFSFSASENRFVSTSCNNFAKLTVGGNVVSGCMSICDDTITEGCDGINCCKTTLSYSLKYINASMEKINKNGNEKDKSCMKMFVADLEWVTNILEHDFRALDITHVPTILEWRIDNATFLIKNTASTYCDYSGCICEDGFEGNPYLPDGCEDIDECADPKLNHCEHYCQNLEGSHHCHCKAGYYHDRFSRFGNCTKDTKHTKQTLNLVFLVAGTGLGMLFLLIGCWWLRKLVRRRKQAKQKEKFFKRNGGLLLQQQISSDKGNFEATKLFTSKELEKATENYNINRVLGQGGQGTVYKGMLTDGKIVAVKKAKIVNEGQLDGFINEVVILSKINHRNIVMLLGCCLETPVPMLVYEYIPNDTLYHYIHNQIEEFPLSWELRLRIASEVAGALSYLHSAASMPIYHRDIKSTNILLDEKYRAKVSDFGTSRSISVEQTHLTTGVKGTFGYLDPEYFQSSQFTEKSDVYSFGVVLVELLTGLKPISSLITEEWRGLAGYFMLKMEENRLFDILDPRVAKEGDKVEILAVANLALRCLNLNGRQRPTMWDVLVELESKLPKMDSSTRQNPQEIEYPTTEVYGELGITSSTSFLSWSRD